MLPSQNFDAHLFHVGKTRDFYDFNDFNDFVVFGPKAPGAHGILHFLLFFENLFFGLRPI